MKLKETTAGKPATQKQIDTVLQNVDLLQEQIDIVKTLSFKHISLLISLIFYVKETHKKDISATQKAYLLDLKMLLREILALSV